MTARRGRHGRSWAVDEIVPVRPVSKAAAAYSSLRSSIQAGELAPGERITLRYLSDMLDMSLTPVREALNRLQAEGFVVHDPHGSTFIAELTPERIEQVYRLRAVLEPLAVRQAGQQLTPGDLEDLRELVCACDQAQTALEVVQRNEAFHYALYRLSRDALMMGFIDQLWAGMPYPSLGLYADQERVSQSSREHHAILDALVAEDLDAAAALTAQHIEHGREAALNRL
nr:GntR family transcriptional regulator [Nesterenkonia sp. AY15]